MLACGGIDSAGHALSDCWVLDLEEMRWEGVEVFSVPSTLGRPCVDASAGGRLDALLQQASPPSGDAPTDLGRCTVAWSEARGAAIVWGGAPGAWTWREPEVLRCKRLERWRAAEGALGVPDARQKLKNLPDKRGRKKSEDCWASWSPALNIEDCGAEPLSSDFNFGACNGRSKTNVGPHMLELSDVQPQIGATLPGSRPAWSATLNGSPAELPGVLPPTRRHLPPSLGAAPDMAGWAHATPSGKGKVRPAAADSPGPLGSMRLLEAPSAAPWGRGGLLEFSKVQAPRRLASRLDLEPLPASRSTTPTRGPARQLPRVARDGW